MAQFRFLVADSVAMTFSALPRKRQRAALEAFERLAANPVTDGLAFVRDVAGRTNYYKGDSGFVIKFWVDHAVAEIRVVGLQGN